MSFRILIYTLAIALALIILTIITANGQVVGTPIMLLKNDVAGPATFSISSCTTASAGALTVHEPVSAVSQTITVNVISTGTYSISVTSSGITFAASGSFSSTGSQNVVLTGAGTPTPPLGTATFTLSGCSFTRTILAHPSSNGTAKITSFSLGTNCGIDSMYCSLGYLGYDISLPGYPGVNFEYIWGWNGCTVPAISGISPNGTAPYQNLTCSVAVAGTYNIQARIPGEGVGKGMTFTANGTLSSTGSQTIQLYSIDAPQNSAGDSTVNLADSDMPDCLILYPPYNTKCSYYTNTVPSIGFIVFHNISL